ncbi:hypothetical protein A5731_22745 [Mycolicibacterium conceptionense]|uniref:Uncharacterized protein n=1 Tax=Mycolicibacterium conceptionense TaxID=451644 RepID=A0A1A1VV86_9MYCO|nr:MULTISPECIES: hypothetical protein [Mycolicibacterium]MCW1820801.1 hypothetical protein [Mycolicibacterium senegalense]OBB10706.1 hypothetical protein A5718_07795 [Mycolicibacterium conceptionense]OBE98516.1 hypothetical protein A5731_22745 [Mycolicibacterium conceptionense]OBF15047.1 hypothetical protein A5726_22985 [Mycolicibacterium conceptionense]OBF30620.1 hypothetical protein A5720_29700 [Mycolicibacterium conceptionense]
MSDETEKITDAVRDFAALTRAAGSSTFDMAGIDALMAANADHRLTLFMAARLMNAACQQLAGLKDLTVDDILDEIRRAAIPPDERPSN